MITVLSEHIFMLSPSLCLTHLSFMLSLFLTSLTQFSLSPPSHPFLFLSLALFPPLSLLLSLVLTPSLSLSLLILLSLSLSLTLSLSLSPGLW